MRIKINKGDAINFKETIDLILTDPPYDLDAKVLSKIINKNKCDHLVLITTMKQLIEFLRVTDWSLSFDFVLDAVMPKKSKSKHTPHYTHQTVVYLTRNGAKSKFNRTLRTRSDTYDGKNYWPTIIRAPRQNTQEHGLAKNQNAITDILGSFDISVVYDPFSGSGTTAIAAWNLDIDCIVTEINDKHAELIENKFKFLGVKKL